MAPSFDFSNPSPKDIRKGTPVAVKLDDPNFSVLEMSGTDTEEDLQSMDKDRGKNAKQFTWVLLLKAHRAAGFVAWSAAVLWALLGAIKERLIFKKGAYHDHDKARKDQLLLQFIRWFMILSMVTLAFELIAYWNGWQYQKPDFHLPETLGIKGWLHLTYLSWLSVRANYIARPIQILANICKVLFIIQSVDRLVQCLGCFWIKFKNIKPIIEGDSFKSTDGSEYVYPKVLVQIPMCNEKEVYQQSISAACHLDWPKDDLLIQVLDDSDDETIQQLIKEEVSKWSQQSINVVYQHRLDRTGYKAGNLRSGMNCDYIENYEFVAIFDADFQPNPDFLKLTVPHFKGDPELGLVQARWSSVNKDENLITRLQNINMCFHFEVEQQMNGHFWNFFGFNGTAGVWRIRALEDSGGWLDRTTVEDMDIAVRAHIKGWKFIFLNDVKVQCEVPESFEAYRKQQHRWHSGPMNLFRLCLPDVIKSKISIWKKANLILLFFLLRKLILPFYSFTLLCVIFPLTMFVPEAELPVWLIFYVPILMSLLSVLPAPRSFHFVVPYLLFENAMSVTKFDAILSGLLQLGSSYEWVVTKKAGRSLGSNPSTKAEKEPKLSLTSQHKEALENELPKSNNIKERKEKAVPKKKANKIYKKELALALLLLTAAARGLLSARFVHFYVLLFQGVSFLIVGLDLISERMI